MALPNETLTAQDVTNAAEFARKHLPDIQSKGYITVGGVEEVQEKFRTGYAAFAKVLKSATNDANLHFQPIEADIDTSTDYQKIAYLFTSPLPRHETDLPLDMAKKNNAALSKYSAIGEWQGVVEALLRQESQAPELVKSGLIPGMANA